MLLSTALEGGSKIKQRDQERTLLQEVPERGMEHQVVMAKHTAATAAVTMPMVSEVGGFEATSTPEMWVIAAFA